MVMYSPAISRKPLRGWLLLLGVGMVFGPMRALSNVLAYADPPMGTAFAKFPTLTHTLLSMDVVSLVLALGLSVVFFRKLWIFKRAFTTVIVYNLLVPLVASVLTSLVTAEPVVPEYVGSWLGYAIVAIPWLIYVHRSQRVRETFVNPLWWAVAGFR